MGTPHAALPVGVTAKIGDLDDLGALQRAAAGATVVFHCAAKVHDAGGAEADFQRVNVEGTRRLLDACTAANDAPPRVVHFSTVAVYGELTPRVGLPGRCPASSRNGLRPVEDRGRGTGRSVGTGKRRFGRQFAAGDGLRGTGSRQYCADDRYHRSRSVPDNRQRTKPKNIRRRAERRAGGASGIAPGSGCGGRRSPVRRRRPKTLHVAGNRAFRHPLAAGIMRTGWTIPLPVALLLSGILERIVKPWDENRRSRGPRYVALRQTTSTVPKRCPAFPVTSLPSRPWTREWRRRWRGISSRNASVPRERKLLRQRKTPLRRHHCGRGTSRYPSALASPRPDDMSGLTRPRVLPSNARRAKRNHVHVAEIRTMQANAPNLPTDQMTQAHGKSAITRVGGEAAALQP